MRVFTSCEFTTRVPLFIVEVFLASLLSEVVGTWRLTVVLALRVAPEPELITEVLLDVLPLSKTVRPPATLRRET